MSACIFCIWRIIWLICFCWLATGAPARRRSSAQVAGELVDDGRTEVVLEAGHRIYRRVGLRRVDQLVEVDDLLAARRRAVGGGRRLLGGRRVAAPAAAPAT